MSARSIVRFAGRVLVVAMVAAFLTVVGVQYARIIERNVVLAHSLSDVDKDIAALKQAREQRLARIHRLEDPHGAVPEIHDRLHLLMPDESIIYLKGRTPAPEPTP